MEPSDHLTKRGVGIGYKTKLGVLYRGRVEDVLGSSYFRALRGTVRLLFTSPPFPLNRKKKYGNLEAQQYVDWLADLAPRLKELLTPTGSIAIEMGNAWVAGVPVMSTLAIEALLEFKRRAGLHLCQEFIAYNPARLPSPVQWVNVERRRVKDAFTRIWWLAATPRPNASNRRILKEYGDDMKKLLKRGTYNSGRPF